MRAARGGDRKALDLLLRRHYDRVYGVCRRICGTDADALDAAQEALIAMAKGINRFDERSAFGTWAYRVATNAAIDELRRRRRRPEPGLSDDTVGAASSATLDSDVAERIDVDDALARVPVEFRVAVVLRDLAGLSYDEIARTLAVPAGTVRSRISRGRAALADMLAPDRNRSRPADRPTTQQ